MRIVLTGGGSGGHIFPLIAVQKKIKEKYSDTDFLYLGPKGGLEHRVMLKEGIVARHILSGKAHRYFSWENFINPIKIFIGICQSLWRLLFYMPDVVFSKGGYASVPVVIAAWIYQIPILTHESDAIPGVANKIIGKLARRVAISYSRSRRYFMERKILLTGNPVRQLVNKGDKNSILEKLKMTESKPIVLVLGGSQGAQKINEAVVKILPELLRFAQVIHQVGEKKYKDTLKMVRNVGVKEERRGYHIVPFLEFEDLKNAYSAADVIISRAGANSISEIAANSKPAILIPIAESANNHQSLNAYALAEVGGAVVLEEANLTEHLLLNKIKQVLNDREFADKLAVNIKQFYHEDAAEKVAVGVLDLVK